MVTLLFAYILMIAGFVSDDPALSFKLFMGATLLFLFVLARNLMKKDKVVKKEPGEPCCPKHKWIYGDDGLMICSICKIHPGDITSSYNKPY